MNNKSLTEIRTSLSEGKVSLGSWIQIPNTSVAEIMGSAGYEWLAVDMEHGSISSSTLPDLFRAIEISGTIPLVRVAVAKEKDCRLALDAGASGVILPMIKSAIQLEEVVDFCSWPPTGSRGVGFSRANLYGKRFDSYYEFAQSPLVIAMIENIEAAENIESILKVRGLDAIFIGPYDLSASMGITGDFNNKEFKRVKEDIISSCKSNSIACGIHQVNPEPKELNLRIQEGFTFIAYSLDSVFLLEKSKNPLNIKPS
jgi:2-dehydro-3-deoxyglucarate aldolase